MSGRGGVHPRCLEWRYPSQITGRGGVHPRLLDMEASILDVWTWRCPSQMSGHGGVHPRLLDMEVSIRDVWTWRCPSQSLEWRYPSQITEHGGIHLRCLEWRCPSQITGHGSVHPRCLDVEVSILDTWTWRYPSYMPFYTSGYPCTEVCLSWKCKHIGVCFLSARFSDQLWLLDFAVHIQTEWCKSQTCRHEPSSVTAHSAAATAAAGCTYSLPHQHHQHLFQCTSSKQQTLRPCFTTHQMVYSVKPKCSSWQPTGDSVTKLLPLLTS